MSFFGTSKHEASPTTPNDPTKVLVDAAAASHRLVPQMGPGMPEFNFDPHAIHPPQTPEPTARTQELSTPAAPAETPAQPGPAVETQSQPRLPEEQAILDDVENPLLEH